MPNVDDRLPWIASAAAVAVLATTLTACEHSQRRPTPDPIPSAAVSASSAPGKLPYVCYVKRLPLPDGQTSSAVTGGDRSGHYLVGRSADADGKWTVLVWHDGELTTTASMPGDDGTLDDINSSGVAIGNSVLDGGYNMPWLFRDGKFTELAVPDDGTATAAAIGEQGTVVGWGNRNPGYYLPFVWQPGQFGATRLDLMYQAGEGRAVDVDADGTIVGDLYSPILSNFGVLWRPGGKPELLPKTKYNVNEAGILPTSISGGVVTGRITGDRPTVLDLPTGSFTIIDQPLGAGPMSRNAWFAGRTGQGLGIVSPTAWKELILPSGTDRSSTATLVKTMSDDGLVLGGQSADPDGATHAVFWRCK